MLAFEARGGPGVDDPAFSSKRIGRYELLTRLAVGGMAEIFLAVERGLAGLERTVVIKRILPQLAEQDSFVQMFLREARIVARLNHPNVVQIHELSAEPDVGYFIVMEYIDGSTARELRHLAAEKLGTMPYAVALGIIAQACRGLHAAHEMRDAEGQLTSVIHRDITPQNLMITPEGHVKLLDFGIAKATAGVNATYSGTLKGKFSYMSPEQCENHPLDRRSDIFSLGIVLWELLTGERLFKRDSELEMVAAVLEAPVPPPSSRCPDVPPEVDDIVRRALERDRDARYQTADEMRRRIEQVAADLGAEIGPDAIARFVRQVAEDQLETRRTTLQEARERTLISVERRQLAQDYDTGPRKRFDEDEPTAARRPTTGSREAVGASPKRGRSRLTRRTALWLGPALAGIAVVAFAIALHSPAPPSDTPGGSGDDPAASFTGEPVLVGWAPTVDRALEISDTEAFRHYLSRHIGRPVQFVLADTYADTARRLSTGELDFAVLPPLLYVRTAWSEPDIDILAIKQYDGAESYDGWLVVPTASDVQTLADLRGRRFCFTDENSTSGFFMPRHLLRQRGYDPDTFIGEVIWSGSHLQALRDVLAGKCDAAATYNGAVFSADSEGVSTGQLRLLAVTGHIPQDAVVSGPRTPEDERLAFQQALLSFDPERDTGEHRVGSVQRITGFSPVTDDAYADLRQAVLAEQQATRPTGPSGPPTP